ncbi:MAG: phosphomannomutase/phosphoglucomutase [Filifactoraceae bacterium]
MPRDLRALQNGTDIRGVAMENPKLEVSLTAQRVTWITKGIIKWASEKLSKPSQNIKIAVGTDSRLSRGILKDSIIAQAMSQGVRVFDCQMATTPAMFMATKDKELNCDVAIMITASHLPYYYNGIKIFTQNGGAEKNDIKTILEYAADLSEKNVDTLVKGKLTNVELIDIYSEDLRNKITKATGMDRPFGGMKIIVDAGNGAGGFFAHKILEPLGANIEGSQFLEPDGNFPNHQPNPENKEAMESITKAVVETKADLGIIFDTDVDRAALVTGDGREVNRNNLIGLISTIVLEEHPKTTIVTDSITSTGLKVFIEEKGGVHHRFKRGYKNVINEAIRLNKEGQDCQLAIETSGHAALKENEFLDDGAYLIAKILIKAAKMNASSEKLQNLIENLKQPKEAKEYRITIIEKDFGTYGNHIISMLKDEATSSDYFKIEEPNYEGIKLITDTGWLLLRMSLHEPLLVLNVESEKEDGVSEIVTKLRDFLEKFNKLDLGVLYN